MLGELFCHLRLFAAIEGNLSGELRTSIYIPLFANGRIYIRIQAVFLRVRRATAELQQNYYRKGGVSGEFVAEL